MKVVRLNIANFRGIKSAELQFHGHTLIIGPNNVGKSTVTCVAYWQDRSSSASEDEWRAKLLIAVEAGNEKRSSAERENQSLREEMKYLTDRIADMEKAQRAAEQVRKAISEDRSRSNTAPQKN